MLNKLLWVYFLIVLHFWKKTIISTCTFYFCFAYNVLLNMCTFYTFLYYIFHLFQDFVTKKQAFWEFNCAKWGNDSLSSLARRAWWKCSRASVQPSKLTEKTAMLTGCNFMLVDIDRLVDVNRLSFSTGPTALFQSVCSCRCCQCCWYPKLPHLSSHSARTNGACQKVVWF